MKHLFLVITLLAASSSGFSASCGDLSPARQNQTLFQPLESEVFNEATHKKLVAFFKRLKKDRDGYSEGYFCDEGRRKVAITNSKVRFRPQWRDNNGIEYYLYFEGDEQGFDKEKVVYDLTDATLFLGPKEGDNQVIVREVSSSTFITYEKIFPRTASGGRMVKEIIRRYQLTDAALVVDNTYYANGFMISENQWTLR